MRLTTLILAVASYLGACQLHASPPFAPPDEKALKAGADRIERVRSAAVDSLRRATNRVDTDHFTISADLPVEQIRGLRPALEGSYERVARLFGVQADEDVLVGKVLVIATTTRQDFALLAQQLDEAYPPESTAGYLRVHKEGSAHLLLLVQPIPSGTAGDAARAEWSAMLAREMTIAFLSRYRADTPGNTPLPAWATRGIAMLVQQSLVPERRIDPSLVKYLASSDFELSMIFDPEAPQGDTFDAAAYSLVGMLVGRDRNAFVRLLDELRAGASAEAAIKTAFGVDLASLTDQWRHHIQTSP